MQPLGNLVVSSLHIPVHRGGLLAERALRGQQGPCAQGLISTCKSSSRADQREYETEDRCGKGSCGEGGGGVECIRDEKGWQNERMGAGGLPGSLSSSCCPVIKLQHHRMKERDREGGQ